MAVMRQRLLLVAGWIAAAVGSALVASAAVAVAGGQVLDQPLRPLTATEVAALPVVQVGSSVDFEPQASGGLVPDGGGLTRGSETVAPGSEEPAGTGGSTAVDVESKGLEAYGPSQPSVVRTRSVEGGQASFLVTDQGLALLWATPSPGYVAQTRSSDAESITVQFSSSLNVWLVEARLDAGDIAINARPEPLT